MWDVRRQQFAKSRPNHGGGDQVDDLVIAALKRLKQAGYLVALDDFVFNDRRKPLTEFPHIIKVDIKHTTPDHYTAMMTKYGSWIRPCWRKK